MVEGDLAVLEELLERLWVLSDLEVEHLPQLDRVVELEHLVVAVVDGGDVVQEDLDDLVEEGARRAVRGLGVLVDRVQSCKGRK